MAGQRIALPRQGRHDRLQAAPTHLDLIEPLAVRQDLIRPLALTVGRLAGGRPASDTGEGVPSAAPFLFRHVTIVFSRPQNKALGVR